MKRDERMRVNIDGGNRGRNERNGGRNEGSRGRNERNRDRTEGMEVEIKGIEVENEGSRGRNEGQGEGLKVLIKWSDLRLTTDQCREETRSN